MIQNKNGYPQGALVRAVWDCCDELYQKLGRAPSLQEFNDEIGKREPHRIGISTHSRQRKEWMRHHNISTNVTDELSIIPEGMLYPQYRRVWYAVTQLKSASAVNIVEWIRNSNAPLKENEIRIQLDALTVNSNARYRYLGSRKNSRTDIGSPYDLLFRSGTRRNTRYEEYVPKLHGVWDIGDNGKTPIQIIAPRPADQMVVEARGELFNTGQKPLDSDLLDEIVSHENEYKLLDQTEKDSIVKSRIGQGLFRDGVVKLWGYCAVTGLNNLSLLRASHIKPWRDSSNQERLNPMNGLLLQPTLDHLFDSGLITFSIIGGIIFSPMLSQDNIQKLGLSGDLKLRKVPTELMSYMEYHRENVFKSS